MRTMQLHERMITASYTMAILFLLTDACSRVHPRGVQAKQQRSDGGTVGAGASPVGQRKIYPCRTLCHSFPDHHGPLILHPPFAPLMLDIISVGCCSASGLLARHGARPPSRCCTGRRFLQRILAKGVSSSSFSFPPARLQRPDLLQAPAFFRTFVTCSSIVLSG